MLCLALGERHAQNPMAFDDTHSLIAVHGELRADDAVLVLFIIRRGDAHVLNAEIQVALVNVCFDDAGDVVLKANCIKL